MIMAGVSIERGMRHHPVLGASGQEIVPAGTVVGQRKQGDAVEWAVLVDETNAVRKFLSPPASLKRLKEGAS